MVVTCPARVFDAFLITVDVNKLVHHCINYFKRFVEMFRVKGQLVIVLHNYAVTTIGNSAFLYCFYLTSLTLPNSVTTIEEGAFAYCSGFTGDLVIPNSVVTIEPSAFFTCYSFDGDLIIGNSVTVIGDYAFDDCNGMHGVLNIPSNVTSIGTSSFRYCAFSGMTVDPANPVFDSRDNCNAIITTSTNELLTGCVNTVIPNTVTAIGENAFSGLEGLTSIDIPNSVTSIGAGAFAFCTGDVWYRYEDSPASVIFPVYGAFGRDGRSSEHGQKRPRYDIHALGK